MNRTYNDLKENKKQTLNSKKDDRIEKLDKIEKTSKTSKKNSFTVSGKL